MAQWQTAFGSEPIGPIPVGARRWARAVDLGARGHAAAARTIVADLLRDRRVGPPIRAAALATRASLTRQAGGHRAARADDGAAVRSAARHRGPWAAAARADALVGLAADNLGVGDFDASARFLARAAVALDGAAADADAAAGDWICGGRPRLRLAWVRTELALYSGDPRSAEFAAQAIELSAAAPSLRHRTKTELIAAAASAAAGDVDHAAAEAERIVAVCRTDELLPLEWAASTMLAGLRPGATLERSPHVLQEELMARGMAFVPLPGSDTTGRYA